MFTVCPKCALTLVVTAEDLRIARGYVRCGTCSSVFNALAQLREDRQGSSGGRAEEPPPGPSAASAAPAPARDPGGRDPDAARAQGAV